MSIGGVGAQWQLDAVMRDAGGIHHLAILGHSPFAASGRSETTTDRTSSFHTAPTILKIPN